MAFKVRFPVLFLMVLLFSGCGCCRHCGSEAEKAKNIPPIQFSGKDGVVLVPAQKYYRRDSPPVVIPELKMPPGTKEALLKVNSDRAYRLLLNSNRNIDYGIDTMFIDIAELRPDHVVYDIGAGPGYYCFAIARRVKKYYGCDIEPACIAFIKWAISLVDGNFYLNPGYVKTDNIFLYVNKQDDAMMPEPADRVYLLGIHFINDKSADRMMVDRFTDSIVKKLKKGGRVIFSDGNEKQTPHFMTMDECIAYFAGYGLKAENIIPLRDCYTLVLVKK